MNIWIPRLKTLEPNRELLVPQRMRGMFKIEAIKPDGRRRLLADWFPNLITDNGLELIGSTGSYLTTCAVGSGNATPANGNTALQTLVGTTTTVFASTQAAQSAPTYFGSVTNTYRFIAGSATGNLAEVGVGLTSTSLFSRALILDGGGSPTTVTVLSSEALDVTYQLQNYPTITDTTGTVVINGITYSFTQRPAVVTSAAQWGNGAGGNKGQLFSANCFNGALGAVTSTPAGTQDSATISNAGYSAGSHQNDGTAFLDLTRGNLSGGISAYWLIFGQSSNLGSYQVGLSPSIPKDSSHTLSMVFRTSWGRYP